MYQPLNSRVILAAWKAAKGNAVDVVEGSPTSTGVTWGPVSVIPRAATIGTPAIAEASTGGSRGVLYVLWQGQGGAHPIDFATAADPLKGVTKWSAPRALPSAVKTGAAPSAQALGTATAYPLLIVFQAVHGSALFYVTLAANGKATSPLPVPHIRSMNGTAISTGVLAAQSPDPGQVLYEPFVRACAGC